jgi:hypothetical protein
VTSEYRAAFDRVPYTKMEWVDYEARMGELSSGGTLPT